MNSRIMPIPEIDVVFYEELTQQQVTVIYRIVNLLAKYALLETSMLMKAYQAVYQERLGLSYVKRAVKERLVIEYRDDYESSSEKPIHYYALKSTTLAYLHSNRHQYLKLPFGAGHREKTRLLAFNTYAIHNEINHNITLELDFYLRFFISEQNVIYIYQDAISHDELELELARRKIKTISNHVSVPPLSYEMGEKTRAVHPTEVD